MKCVALVVLMALVAANAQFFVPPGSPGLPAAFPLFRSFGAWNAAPYSYYGARLAYDPIYNGVPAVYPGYAGVAPVVVDGMAKSIISPHPGLTLVKTIAPEEEKKE